MHRSRRNSLTGVAHRIAMRLQEISKAFIDRGEEAPMDILAREFQTACAEYAELRGGPLTTLEMELLAKKFVPRAIGQIERRNQRSIDEGFPK
jgi:hypothetical protein